MIDEAPCSLPSKLVPAMLKLAVRPRGGFTSFAMRLALAAVVILAVMLLYVYLPEQSRLHQWTWTPEAENPLHGDESDDVCVPFTGLEKVVISVKTGATEASQRIPIQLRTTLRCAPHVYIFSDMAQKIGGVEIFDSLDETAEEVKEGNTDFDIYRKQQELKDPEKIASQLKSMKSPPGSSDLAAWTLDKYKNIHIVEKTWALKPDMDWYLHIDADTYVIWPSLVEWLKRLDKSQDLFLGSVSYLNDLAFAHGGSGILLSGQAMRIFAGDHTGTAARWDPEIHDWCCGDSVLAEALREYGIGVMNSWPTINGESQNTIPFDDEHWCNPIVTMHHVSTDEMEEMAEFEDRRPDKSKPLRYEELFKEVQAHKFPEYKKHWDNMADGSIVQDVSSAKECRDLCISHEKCFQSKFDGSDCTLGTKYFSMGYQKLPDGSQRWESYWNVTRIAKWVEDRQPCSKLEFPYQHEAWSV